MISGAVVCVGAGPLTGVCLDLSVEITGPLIPYLHAVQFSIKSVPKFHTY